MNAFVSGDPNPVPLVCGVNGTPCTTPDHVASLAAGSSTSEVFGPFYATIANQRFGNRIQYIFTAAELQANGMPYSGTISQLDIDVATSLGSAWNDFEIKIGCTSQSDFSTPNFINGLTSVFGPQSYSSTNGFNSFQIAPYDWDGSSNIVVEFCSRTASGNTDPEEVTYTTTGANFRTLYRHDQCNCSACGQATGTASINRANMLFTICDAPAGIFTYSWLANPTLTGTSIPGPQAQTVNPPDTFLVTVFGGACPVADTVVIVDCGVLPVDELEFSGQPIADRVELNWLTFNEYDVNYFEVYHSIDGENFDAIGQTAGTGNGIDWREYKMDHLEPFEGRNYYRLKVVDFNGQARLSKTIEVLYALKDGIVAMYPNPAAPGQSVTLDYYAAERQQFELSIVDVMGRILRKESYVLTSGVNSLNLPIAGLAKASYFVRIKSDLGLEMVKLMILD